MIFGKGYVSFEKYAKDGLRYHLKLGLTHLLSSEKTEIGELAGIQPSKIGFSIGLTTTNLLEK